MFVERRAWACRRCVVPDQIPPPTLTTKAPPSIAASFALLHRLQSVVAGDRGDSGRLIVGVGAAKNGVFFAFVWWRVDDAPRL
jgi:hypothetical protein